MNAVTIQPSFILSS